jgi:hypothetical protein
MKFLIFNNVTVPVPVISLSKHLTKIIYARHFLALHINKINTSTILYPVVLLSILVPVLITTDGI